MSTINQLVELVYDETTRPNGFMWKIRENEIDRESYSRARKALHELKELLSDSPTVPKLLAACLCEVPWEIENCIEHYQSKDCALGQEVSKMADCLREDILALLWRGLEDRYENLGP